ncbi:hypothetical protein [Thetidibacter halocola]|uniref:Uncharacterized protein n=1 Tax=Thetidibacter halocola TaxID=2827239 RepID=A0A8J7WD62_9RHOB|nr:hypothetical protein [Thetidibacter halocola]MBS0124587.1 hypothetical protein [Thetidibacter halocola]
MWRALPLLLTLAACQAQPPTTATRSGDGMADRLRPGMTENDAFGLFGPESGFERNPADWDQSCLSYAYGPVGAPLYVHALFRAGALEQATDGHAGLCTFAAA